ncbi:rhomboid family intramembrane serine protease [Pontimicrobium aquaticum]|uniref:Rhomboid family intramembrane serine protease n=1 Tax=Pontimicrobium aquaticum TaxID=2565367 RepID=A0A4U0EWF2_9FLAO|nr:rhomboid family intramembrane serine protease [Pontimicrobium aquaticum]TJY36266.1 rhomboid family intramembrane serine protease [Pontimicrobium aquaticum]
MTSLTQDIQGKLKRLTAFEKIIAANVAIYIIGWFVANFSAVSRNQSLEWLVLPKEFSEFIFKPWSIITYGFAHVDFWHLFFNVFVLYFIGRSFSNLFNIKLSLNVYFLGIISGALAYMLAYALFPGGILKFTGALLGASAGVRAALIFLCAYMPNYEVRLITFNIKLMYIGLVLVVLDLLGLFSGNAGGNIAHLGGDVLGFFYATQLKKGIDIGKGFERIMDSFSSLFSKKSPLKTVHKSKRKTKAYAGHTKDEFNEFNKQKQIDIILDKISKSGYESLSKEEKEFLFRSGK